MRDARRRRSARVYFTTQPDPEPSYRLGRELFAHLDREGRPTAVFAASDTIAIGLLQAAFQATVVVPDQMSIVGFDDIDIAAFTIPPLTTISQSGVEMGRISANLLLDLIEAGPAATHRPTSSSRRRSSSASRRRLPAGPPTGSPANRLVSHARSLYSPRQGVVGRDPWAASTPCSASSCRASHCSSPGTTTRRAGLPLIGSRVPALRRLVLPAVDDAHLWHHPAQRHRLRRRDLHRARGRSRRRHVRHRLPRRAEGYSSYRDA